MNWLTPLGFLGLISLVVLIIIYIIKPNYQNKIISSTFVWKLSLRYKKKSIPINRLRNILIFICQMLILALSSLMLVGPYIDTDTTDVKEHVLIIDASASMLAETGGVTRFEEAVDTAYADVKTLLEKEDTRLSIILAADKASFVVRGADSSSLEQVKDALDALCDGDTACTEGVADLTGAIELAEEITAYTEGAAVTLYTDTSYADPDRVKVKKIGDINDFNAAILDVRAVNVENYYRFEIDVACYGRSSNVRVYFDLSGVNDELLNMSFTEDVSCVNGEVKTICFGKVLEEEIDINVVEDISVYAFNNAHAHIEERDSLDGDNSFYLYGGRQQPLRIQYKSSKPNNYFGTALIVLRDKLKYRWNIDFVEVMPEEEAATDGFDIYIFEHEMPTVLPTDGVVILANPDKAPAGAGFMIGGELRLGEETSLSAGDPHRITNMLSPSGITVTRYREITSSDGYENLLYCNGKPVMIAKNDTEAKIAVMSFSLNYSNLALLLDFPLMMYNIIEYYMPSTLTEHVFEVGDKISLNCRGEELELVGGNIDTVITEFPTELTLSEHGVYTTMYTTLSGNAEESFFVRIPRAESNIHATEDALINPIFLGTEGTTDIFLLYYLAMALVALLFAEWWLYTREQY